MKCVTDDEIAAMLQQERERCAELLITRLCLPLTGTDRIINQETQECIEAIRALRNNVWKQQ